MAVTQRARTVVNSARKAARRRKLSAKQIAAGFGGKRRKSAVKAHRRRTKPAKAATKKNRSVRRRRNKPAVVQNRPRHTVRRKRRTTAKRANLGKIISFSLPKESIVATTKRNRGRKASRKATSRRRTTKRNTGHRRRSVRRNAGMGDLTGLVTSAVFTIAGAVGTKYITQMVLTTSNTGVMGYFGNLVSAFLLSWGVKSFMRNDRAAAAVLSGGIVQIVLRLIADYTPFGQYTANLGMGDYLTQFYVTPQRMLNGMHSAEITMGATQGGNGYNMGGCGSGGGLYGGNQQYGAA